MVFLSSGTKRLNAIRSRLAHRLDTHVTKKVAEIFCPTKRLSLSDCYQPEADLGIGQSNFCFWLIAAF